MCVCSLSEYGPDLRVDEPTPISIGPGVVHPEAEPRRRDPLEVGGVVEGEGVGDLKLDALAARG
jgi:hypothetical protein